MREKYESLSVAVLRDVAKARGLKHLSGLKKKELVELMLEEDKKDALKEDALEETEEKDASRAEKKTTDKKAADKKAEKGEEEITGAGNKGTARGEEKTAGRGKEKTVVPADKGTAKSEHSDRYIKNERIENGERQERKPTKVITADGIEIDNPELDSGISAHGILEVMPDGYGFIRCENYLPGENDVYVSPSQIRKFGLKTGDIIQGNTRVKTQQEKFSALLYIRSINGCHPSEILRRPNFEDLTPIFPNERIRLETDRSAVAMRIMDVVSPIGKGQRGMIVSPPKAGKTTLLKQVA